MATEIEVVTVRDLARSVAAGRRCFVTNGTHHAKTLLGATFYKFHHRADWCTDGARVIGVHYREHTLAEVSNFAVFRGLVEDFTSVVPAPEVVSVKKGHVENCLTTQGCLSSKYPYVRLTLRADGSSFPTDGE